MFGDDPRAGGLRLRDERLEARLFGRRGMNAPLEGFELLAVLFGCLILPRERGLKRGDAVAMLPVAVQQRELAFLDHLLELDQLRLSSLFVRGLRFELVDQPLGMMLVGERRGPQVFGDGLFEMIARRAQTFLGAHAVHLGALFRALEKRRSAASLQASRAPSRRTRTGQAGCRSRSLRRHATSAEGAGALALAMVTIAHFLSHVPTHD